jgi:hypothetical protein
VSFRTAVEFLVLSFCVRVNPVTRQLLIKRKPVKKGRKVLKRGKERRNEKTIHKVEDVKLKRPCSGARRTKRAVFPESKIVGRAKLKRGRSSRLSGSFRNVRRKRKDLRLDLIRPWLHPSHFWIKTFLTFLFRYSFELVKMRIPKPSQTG